VRKLPANKASPDPPSDEESDLSAMVLRSLCSDVKWERSASTTPLERVALDWQQCGDTAVFAEIHGLNAGAPHGRVVEIFGRAAAAGEQLGLAGTCLLEAQRWQRAPAIGARENMAMRALAEMAGYYATATAHGPMNVTLRTLLLSPASADAINRVRDYRSAKGFPPFSGTREAWRPFSSTEVGRLRPAVEAGNDTNVSAWYQTVAGLAGDARWQALTARRHEDFHRWRPQSIASGVAPKNPWEFDPEHRFAHLSFPAKYKPLDAYILVTEAEEGLDALGDAMRKWMDTWPSALRGLGCPIL
jgi:hypothetical protein